MAKSREKFVLILFAVIAIAVVAGIKLTESTDQPTAQKRRSNAPTMARLVNQQLYQTTQQFDKLVDTRDELRLVRNTQRLADNELDLAFASALRDAKVHPPADSPATKELRDRIKGLDDQIKFGQEQVKQLTAAAAAAKGDKADELQDELQLLQAELNLHQGEQDDAKLDLMRAGGDPQSRIQRQFNQHEASQHNDQNQGQNQSQVWLSKPESYQVPGTLVAQVRAWQQLRSKGQQIDIAGQQAKAQATDLDKKHDQLEQHVNQLAQENRAARAAAVGNDSKEQSKANLAAIRHEAEDRKTLAEYDQRTQDAQQLAQAYSDWDDLVVSRMRACIHGALKSLLWIILIGMGMVAGNIAVERASAKLSTERRRLATMRLLGRFAVQLVGILFILLVVLGSPGQLSTVLALAGAGLTVALKDFIVAFFGWFVLMGKNGIRVGDWVEINGISGEVVEIGLLRTVLLETGNWADSGHPTGRRVTFVNSFAIEGHYFNFSTTGQWLWDSIEVGVPSGKDPYATTEAIIKLVTKESEENTREAEQEWRRAANSYGVKSFSAAPGINVRPTANGVNINVRYITRAHQRYEMRTKIYREIVELLHGVDTRTHEAGS
jgi:small-conductance mechanosensitive channel